jgi:hypothetical protein
MNTRIGPKIRVHIFILLILLTLAGCGDPIDVFSDYRGVNLLDSQGLDQWALHDSVTAEIPLMVFTDVTTSLAASGSSLPEDGPNDFYRLEVKNMLPNGDFEGDISEQWTEKNPGPNLVFETTPNSKANSFWWLSGDVLRHDSDAASESYAYVDLENELIRYPTETESWDVTVHFSALLPSDKYSYSFGIYKTPGLGYISEATVSAQAGTDLTIYRLFPAIDPVEQEISGNTENTFSIGGVENRYFSLQQSESNLDLHFDNLRIARVQDANFSYSLETGLTREDSTRRPSLPLQSGTYEFSIYVKPDPVVTPDPQGLNRFPARFVTISIIGQNKVASRTYDLWSGNPKDGFTQPTDWVQLRLTTENLIGSLYGVSGDTELIRLQIIPTAMGDSVYNLDGTEYENAYPNEDAGSILIAQPRLEFLPGE